MLIKSIRHLALILITITAFFILNGCGGGGGGTTAVNIRISWTALPPGGVMPASYKARVLSSGTEIVSSIQNHPITEPDSIVRLVLPSGGDYVIEVVGYNQQNAQGTAIVYGWRSAVISSGDTVTAGFAAGTSVSSVLVFPSTASLLTGQTKQLYVSAFDSNSDVVLLPQSYLIWSTANNSIAEVNTTGLVTAKANGTTNITARESASNKSDSSQMIIDDFEWTVMVFLNAANDLDDYGVLNVNQMEAGLSSSKIRVVTQWKRISNYAQVEPWTGVRRYLIEPDANMNQVVSPIIETLDANTDMGSWQNLRDFISWSKTNYPAKRYALVIWNHGNGILRSPVGITRDVSYDGGTGNAISINQLDDALSPNGKLDMVIFDASLMQMLEVAWQIRSYSDVVVGSEESPPGEGYPYNRVLAQLSDNPTANSSQFAGYWVSETISAYNGRTGITQSAIATSQLPAVKTALDDLGSELFNKRDSLYAPLVTAGLAPSYKNNLYYKDLSNLAERFSFYTNDPEIIIKSNAVISAVQNAVIAEGHSSDESFSHGISIYYPYSGNFSGQFNQLSISSDAPYWRTFIESAP